MHFANQDESDAVMNEINMTPLVDVMLVLLIIFIIAVPAMQQSVTIELPQASSRPEDSKAPSIELSVAADGSYYWNAQKIDDAELRHRLAAETANTPQPVLHLRGDQAARYERIAKAMAAAQQAGIRSMGFITEPAPR